MRTFSPFIKALAATSVALAAGLANAAISEDFSAGAGGWQAVDLPGSGNYGSVISTFSVTYFATGGSPGGYIRASDPSSNSFYFDAPGTFLGNLGGYQGGTLAFDTYYTPNTAANAWRDDADVLIYSGSQILAWRAASNPGASWTHVSTTLGVGQGWRVGSITGAVATADNISSVLGNVTALRIRGEYVNGVTETTGLDNVAISAVPEPESWALLLAGIGLIGLRRRGAQAGSPTVA